jgi:hypothetical protein
MQDAHLQMSEGSRRLNNEGYMPVSSIQDLIPALETAIGPVILISGVGLLLLTMTNRLGRIIDRSRALSYDLSKLSAERRERVNKELEILWSRAQLIRIAIILASLSSLFAAVLVILLFLIPLFHLDMPLLITALFIICMASLIASLIVFILDVNHTLSALKIELEGQEKSDA